jgi:hypothetical protein
MFFYVQFRRSETSAPIVGDNSVRVNVAPVNQTE